MYCCKSFFQNLLLGIILLSMYANKATAQVYDVDIILDKILCKKAVEFFGDTYDDLAGSITIQSYVINDFNGVKKKYGFFAGTPDFYNSMSTSSMVGNTLWSRGNYNPLKMATGQTESIMTVYTLNNLSLSRLLSFEFLIGGHLDDIEPLILIGYQPCTTCTYNFSPTRSGSGSKLNYRLMKLSSYKSQIEMMATGTSKFLTIGTDQTFQLDFYESDTNSAHVQFILKIKVSKK